MDLKKRDFRIGKLRFTAADIAALIVFAAVAACLFFSAPYGLTENDEAMYQVYEYRLMKGDRLFFDDWTLTPFSTVFNFLPFSVYYLLAGGADGALLALRYFFAVCKLAGFAAVYCALRRYGWAAVLAASVFTGAFAFGMKTLNYYFVCGAALLFVGWVLFVRENNRPFAYALAGFVFSMAVLAEPSMAAIWAVYSLLALIRFICKKKGARFLESYDFVLAPRVWRALLYGVLAAALLLAALCAAFWMRAPLSGLARGFMNALNDPERSGGLGRLLAGRLNVVRMYAGIYHPALLAPALLLAAACVFARRFFPKAEPVCFALAAVLYAALTVRCLTFPPERIGYAVGETVCHSLPLCLPAAAGYCFTRRRDRRLLAFLLFGFAAMLCGDMISMTAFGAFSEVIAVPSVLLLRAYCLDVRARFAEADERKPRRKAPASAGRRVLCAALACLAVCMPAAEAAHGVYLLRLHETERLFVRTDAPLDARISAGALKGLITTAQIAEAYEKSVRDARRINAICSTGLYVADLAPAVYLDADAPVAAHSPYYYNLEGWERVSLWWEMHPQKRPDVVYIPYVKLSFMEYADASPEEKLAWLQAHAEIDAAEGEIGLIVRVLRWNET